MVTIFRFKNLKFKINDNDHNPPHVHVEGAGASVRINLMAKKIKYGTVDLDPDEFKDEYATALISIKMPMLMLKDLRRLALNEKYQGRYQTLMKDILAEYIAKQGQDKKRKSV